MRKLGEYLTVGEAADLLGVSAWTLRYWDRTGKFTPTRHPFSGYRLYRREQIDEILQRAAGGEHVGGAAADGPEMPDHGRLAVPPPNGERGDDEHSGPQESRVRSVRGAGP